MRFGPARSSPLSWDPGTCHAYTTQHPAAPPRLSLAQPTRPCKARPPHPGGQAIDPLHQQGRIWFTGPPFYCSLRLSCPTHSSLLATPLLTPSLPSTPSPLPPLSSLLLPLPALLALVYSQTFARGASSNISVDPVVVTAAIHPSNQPPTTVPSSSSPRLLFSLRHQQSHDLFTTLCLSISYISSTPSPRSNSHLFFFFNTNSLDAITDCEPAGTFCSLHRPNTHRPVALQLFSFALGIDHTHSRTPPHGLFNVHIHHLCIHTLFVTTSHAAHRFRLSRKALNDV